MAWLNSKLFQYTFECFFDGLKMQGGYLLYSSPNVSKMFIKDIPIKDQKSYVDLVDKILASKKQGKDTKEFEKKIDLLFYQLYDITQDEQKTIEG